VNHVNCFDPAQSNPSTPERFESQRRPDFLFDESVILFNDVIEVFAFSDFNAFIVFLVIAFNPRFIGAALVDVYLGWFGMGFHRSVQEPQSRFPIALCGKDKVNRQAFFINRTIKKFPFSFDRNICLIHALAAANRSLPTSKVFLDQRSEFQNPSVEGGMIHLDSAFFHHLFNVPIAQGIRQVPAGAQ